MEKKGEISSTFLIWTLISIAGFAILLFMFYQLGIGGQTNNQICHESVVLRATMPSIAQSYIPLKCKTQKVCITSGLFGGNCDESYGKGASGINKVRVSSITDVEKILSENILECWSMMGEGKVSLFSQFLANTYGIGTVYSSCSICSRVAFDKNSLNKKGIDLSKMNLENYMMTHAAPGKEISYYDVISSGGKARVSVSDKIQLKSLEEKKIGNEEVLAEGGTNDILLEDKFDDPASTKDLAIMFMQISAPQHGQAFKNALVTLGGGAVGGPVRTFQIAKSGGWWTAAILAVAGIYQQYSVAQNRAISGYYCGDISAGSEARDGCSVVRTVNYDEEGVKDYCSIVESVP